MCVARASAAGAREGIGEMRTRRKIAGMIAALLGIVGLAAIGVTTAQAAPARGCECPTVTIDPVGPKDAGVTVDYEAVTGSRAQESEGSAQALIDLPAASAEVAGAMLPGSGTFHPMAIVVALLVAAGEFAFIIRYRKVHPREEQM